MDRRAALRKMANGAGIAGASLSMPGLLRVARAEAYASADRKTFTAKLHALVAKISRV